MPFLKNLLLNLLSLSVFLSFAACGGKKKPQTGDELADVKDFIEFFKEPVKSFQAGDTILNKKEKDSAAVSYSTLIKFVPDSVLARVVGKGVKPKSYPLARLQDQNKTHYLVMKTVATTSKGIVLFCFDDNEKLLAATSVLKPDQLSNTTQSISIDRNFNIAKNISRRNADGSVSDGKEVFVLNEAAGNFMLILTEQLDDKPKELINPIDTFTRKQKYSADYTAGKNNLVSIRDGKKSDRYIFFIHFEKNKGECTGELKGEISMTGKNTAEYHEAGDPCGMQFIFSASSVMLKELEGCAAHRGLRCSFDGSFAKKKNLKPSSAPAKNKK